MIRRPPRSPLFPSTTLSRPPPISQEPQVYSRLLGASRRFPRAASLLATPRGSKSCSPLPAPVWLFQIDPPQLLDARQRQPRSEEHTSDSSHGYISYAVFCLK